MATKPTAAQLATIAAQFIISGEDQDIALAKANTLYFAAVRYLKRFNAMKPFEQAMDIDDDNTVRESIKTNELAIGDSEKNSPALDHFRAIAKTKLEKNISYRAFTALIQRECGRLPETIMPSVLENLHARLRAKRSQARSKRRKKQIGQIKTNDVVAPNRADNPTIG
jgi:hypothetical protein